MRYRRAWLGSENEGERDKELPKIKARKRMGMLVRKTMSKSQLRASPKFSCHTSLSELVERFAQWTGHKRRRERHSSYLPPLRITTLKCIILRSLKRRSPNLINR